MKRTMILAIAIYFATALFAVAQSPHVVDFNNPTAAIITETDALSDKLDLIQPSATDNINTIAASLAETLDLARSGDSGSTVMNGSEQTIYEETDTTAFVCYGGYIDWTGLNAAAGEDTTIKGYVKIVSGGSYIQFYEETFLAAALPDPLGVPFPRDIDTQTTPSILMNTYGVKYTATQAAVGGGWNTIVTEVYDAKAGG